MIRRHAASKVGASICLLCGWLIGAACTSEDDEPNFNSTGSGGASGTGGTTSTGGSKSTGGTTSTGGSKSTGGDGGQQNGTGGSSNPTGSGGDPGSAGKPGSGGEGGEDPEIGGGGPGGAPAAGAGGEGGGEPVVYDTLDNPGFELGSGTTITGWTNEGTAGAAFISGTGTHTGSGRLGHWTQWVDETTPDYTARTFQTVSPIENGTYSFSLWLDRDWVDEQYLYATGFDAEDSAAVVEIDTTDVSGYTKVTLSNIVVTSGSCTIGVYTAAPAGSWANFDDAEFTLAE